MNALCEAVRRALAQAGLLRADARLVCGVSGGADSVALLHALLRVRAEAGFTLYAAHVQHNLRGEASREDERFVRALCETNGIACLVEALWLDADMDAPGIEALARKARYEAFARIMRETQAHALLLAHHQDDQAETVLMRLLRGSGTTGLCGMRERTPFGDGWLLRPFLALPRARILEALAAEGLPHREDESNALPVTLRNALRLNVMPELERLSPGASERIARTAARLQTDEDLLGEEAERLLARALYVRPPLYALRIPRLAMAPPALRRRALRAAWAACGGPGEERALSWTATLALEALLNAPAGDCLNLPGGLKAVRAGRLLHLVPQTGLPKPEPEPPQAVLPGAAGYAFRFAHFRQDEAQGIPTSPDEAVLSPAVLALRPVLRLPGPDDEIRPLGAPGGKSLRRFFTDRKADPFLRWRVPVLAVERQILWAPGLCVSEGLRLTGAPAGSIRLTLDFEKE